MWLQPKLTHTVNSLFNYFLHIFRGILEIQWGAWALISLYLSLLSGIVIGLQYEYTTPFFSTTTIDLIIPFGRFFRSLHFYSSQFFFFFACFHFLLVYKTSESYSLSEWLKLITSLFVIILLLFTGYILKGDNTGASAGLIAENIALSIPVIGSFVNSLLLSIYDSGFRKVYIQHVVSLDILLLVLIWSHLRKYRVNVRDHLSVIVATILFCVWVTAPLEPEELGLNYISGPWFFLGLQELLRYFPPLFAGVVVPLFFLLLLPLLHPKYKPGRTVHWLIVSWLIGYALLSAIAWLR